MLTAKPCALPPTELSSSGRGDEATLVACPDCTEESPAADWYIDWYECGDCGRHRLAACPKCGAKDFVGSVPGLA